MLQLWRLGAGTISHGQHREHEFRNFFQLYLELCDNVNLRFREGLHNSGDTDIIDLACAGLCILIREYDEQCIGVVVSQERSLMDPDNASRNVSPT